MQLKQYLHVENLLPLKNIGSVMRDELNTCLCSDFTEQTTPLFLHQVMQLFQYYCVVSVLMR